MNKNYSLKFNRINVSSKIGIEEDFYPKVELRFVVVALKWTQIVRVFEKQFSDSISTVRRILTKVKGDAESKVESEYQKDKKRYKN